MCGDPDRGQARRLGVQVKRALFLTVLALAAISCSPKCEGGAVCGNYNIIGATQLPTPTPTPGATPDPCVFTAIRVSLKGGVQLPFLGLGKTEQLDATPMSSSGPIPDGCNVAREPFWSALTPLTCQVIGNGYNPFVRGLGVGACSITASMNNIVSAPFSIEVK